MLGKNNKKSPLNDDLIHAIKTSIKDGNASPANQLLKQLSTYTKRHGAKEALIKYLEKWGRLCYKSEADSFDIFKRTNPKWSDDYEAQVKAHPWTNLIQERQQKTVVDADKEFRKLYGRLERQSQDPSKTILHAQLIAKVRDVILTYGRSDEFEREMKRGRTLYDKSTAATTIRASKYAKGA